MNVTFKPGTLYFEGEPIGEPLEVELSPVGVSEDVERFTKIIRDSAEATFEVQIPRLSILSLCHGRKVTNNWLKMHGGVMSRGRRKC